MSKKPNYLKISNIKKKPKCLAPWMQLWAKVMPQGYMIKPCCVYEDEFNTDNIETYLNSNELKKLTETLENGEWAPGCWRCAKGDQEYLSFEKELKISQSRRDKIPVDNNTSLSLSGIKKVLKDSDDQFTMLDIRPGNLCNLKCRMCNSSSSTEIAKENVIMVDDKEFMQSIEKLYDKSTEPHILIQPRKYFEKYSDHTYSQSETHKHRINKLFEYADLHRIKLLGGEPSIDPAIISILQDLIDKGYDKNDNFKLQIVTNMTNLNKTWQNYFEKLNVKVIASVDGAGRTYEYIRYPAKWKAIEQNIKTLKPTKSSMKSLSMNVVMSNILFLDIKHWIPKLQELQEQTADFHINFIECPFPKHMSIDIIPQKYKKIILKDIRQLLSNKRYVGNVRSILERAEIEVNKSLFKENNINLLKAFFITMMKQDKLRKQNLFDINYTEKMYNEYMVD